MLASKATSLTSCGLLLTPDLRACYCKPDFRVEIVKQLDQSRNIVARSDLADCSDRPRPHKPNGICPRNFENLWEPLTSLEPAQRGQRGRSGDRVVRNNEGCDRTFSLPDLQLPELMW